MPEIPSMYNGFGLCDHARLGLCLCSCKWWNYSMAGIDNNANEVPNAKSSDSSLISILGINAEAIAVFIAVAALPVHLTQILLSFLLVWPFNAKTSEAFHVCSNNNFCQTSRPYSFNTVSFRYGKIKRMPLWIRGFGARKPLRPLDYLGRVRSHWSLKKITDNRVTAICKPGRDPEASMNTQNSTTPPSPTYIMEIKF